MTAPALKDLSTTFRGAFEGKDGTYAIEYQDDDSWTAEHLLVSGDITCSQDMKDEAGNISWDTRIEAVNVAMRHAGIIPPIPPPDRRGLVEHSRKLA
jgi:hypothetical protein